MENKVLGIAADKYVKICYLLVLIPSGAGVLSNLFGLFGLNPLGSLGIVIGLLGFVGIALAATAWAGFKDKFTDLDVSHLKFQVLLFVAFFVAGMILGISLLGMGLFGRIIMLCFAGFQFSLLFTGLSLWKSSSEATKDNIINGLKNLPALLKR